MKSKYVQHENSPLREIADLVVEGRQVIGDIEVTEQLWARTMAKGVCKLCSIPYYLNGFGIGDEIRVTSDFVLANTLRTSSQISYRIFISSVAECELIVQELRRLGAEFEPFDSQFMGVTTKTPSQAKSIKVLLQRLAQNRQIEYEDTRSPL